MSKYLFSILGLLLSLFPMKLYSESSPTPLFLTPPFLGRPAETSITINLLPGEKDIVSLVKYREAGKATQDPWKSTAEMALKPFHPSEVNLVALTPGILYEYQVWAHFKASKEFSLTGEYRFRTKPGKASSISFALISDSHITPFDAERFSVLSRISASVRSRMPDFLFLLGDNIQTFTTHGGPMTEERFGPALYAQLRRGLGETSASVPSFFVNGNWEGENGWHPGRERQWAKKARIAFIPTPGATTYPEGGSPDEDYYGFTWGDALFLVLNVTGYTPRDHALQSPVGKADDWTLGEKQKKWLHDRLSTSKAKWKLLFIHHTVGGNAGDDVNSRYGRGGGRAAKVGEQAVIHGWMKEFGAQALFYGHDHVFTDIPVEDIHYICAGSAGAPWKFGVEITGYEKYWTPSGYTWVEVNEKELKVSFIQVDLDAPEGNVLHTFIVPFREGRR